jgi:hypothetical protein
MDLDVKLQVLGIASNAWVAAWDFLFGWVRQFRGPHFMIHLSARSLPSYFQFPPSEPHLQTPSLYEDEDVRKKLT